MNNLPGNFADLAEGAARAGLVVAALLAVACSADKRDDGEPAQPAADRPVARAAAEPPTAIVLDKEIRSTDFDVVNEEILTRLFDRYREQNGIDASEAEITAFVDDLRRRMAADPDLGAYEDLAPGERVQADEMQREMARSMITRWKINRAMYEEYGGRLIGQQLGPEPLDAYRQFLEAQQAAGDFVINDPAIEASFWRYFRDESMHSFIDPEDAGDVFAAPPWEQR